MFFKGVHHHKIYRDLYAQYEKQIDAEGNTVLSNTTTYNSNDEIISVVPKFPIGPK